MTSPGDSVHPARMPPQITPWAMVSALTMSPDLVMPPSARMETFFAAAAFEQTWRAVICGMPTPATMRVVQIEPGP